MMLKELIEKLIKLKGKYDVEIDRLSNGGLRILLNPILEVK